MANAIQTAVVNAISEARPDVQFTVTSSGQPQHSYEKPRTYREGTMYMDANNFPTITIGDKGGVGVCVPSWNTAKYPRAYDAAIVADKLLLTLLGRLASKVTAPSNVLVAGNGGFSTPVSALPANNSDPFKDVPVQAETIETIVPDQPTSAHNGKRQRTA